MGGVKSCEQLVVNPIDASSPHSTGHMITLLSFVLGSIMLPIVYIAITNLN